MSRPNARLVQSGLRLTILAALMSWCANTTAKQLEEIIVTAEKVEASVQETALSMSVFSADQLKRPALQDLTDLGRFAPNVVFDLGTGNTGSSNNSQMFIRGVGQTDFLFSSDPGVGLYVDEVYRPRVTGSVLDLIDLERVEILRGPQGTLYGKNTIGGAVNMTSTTPGHEFAADLSATVGSRGKLDVKGLVDLPVVENVLAARLSFSSRRQDGYVDHLRGDDGGDVNSDAVRAMAVWTPADDLEMQLSGDYTRGRESAIANELIEVNPAAPVLGLWNALVAPALGGEVYDGRNLISDGNTRSTAPSFSDIDDWGASVKVIKNVSERSTFKSITAYRETESNFGMDVDYSPLPYLQSTNDNEHDQFSQEFQFSGRSGSGGITWVVGAFYMQEDGSDLFDLDLAGGLFQALEALPPGIIPGLGGVGNPFHVGLDFDASISNTIDIESFAAYFQGSYDISEQLTLTLGARYTDEQKDLTTSMMRNASGVVAVPPTKLSESWDAFTPKLALEYRQTDALMWYLSASRGFKSGGFNGRAASPAELSVFDPEYVWSYEVGLKSEWLDRRLMLNLAAFKNDYTDMQLTSVRDVQGLLVVVTENAGEAEMQGVELDFAALVGERMVLRGGLGYLDAKYTKLDPGATVSRSDDLVKTPKWTANLVAEIDVFRADAGTLTFSADASYRSAHVNELTNYAALEQNGFTLLGAQVRFVSADERWSATLYGSNLTDKRYMTNGLQAIASLGTADAAFGRPREWGLSMNVRF